MKNSDLNPEVLLKKISTSLQWDDLVLDNHLLSGLEEIKGYMQYGKILKQDYQFGKNIKPGFKALFAGPSGTGKTLAATLLGNHAAMDVYKVDLSLLVSKYIGETEKNLSRVFDRAASKNWILFFDEADSLFGKRSSVSNAHERYANQEVSYFLQRIEEFDGIVILSSNFMNTIDETFFRRFQLVLNFKVPDAHQRSILWKKLKTEEFKYDKDIDIEYLAEQHEFTGASIVNILHYSILKSLRRQDRIIKLNDLQAGIKIEHVKEGKSII